MSINSRKDHIYIALLCVLVSLADLRLYGTQKVKKYWKIFVLLDEIKRNAIQVVTYNFRVSHIAMLLLSNEHFHKKFISHFYTNIHRYFLIMK